jgi:hypothetical protein
MTPLRAVASFAEANDIPWVKFVGDDRKLRAGLAAHRQAFGLAARKPCPYCGKPVAVLVRQSAALLQLESPGAAR